MGVPAQLALAWARSETRPTSSQGPREQLAYSLCTRNTPFPGPLALMATAPPPKEWLSARDPELQSWGHTTDPCPPQAGAVESRKPPCAQGSYLRGLAQVL